MFSPVKRACPGCNKQFTIIGLTRHLQQTENENCHNVWNTIQQGISYASPVAGTSAPLKDFFEEYNFVQSDIEDVIMEDITDEVQNNTLDNNSDTQDMQHEDLSPYIEIDSDDESDDGFEYVFIFFIANKYLISWFRDKLYSEAHFLDNFLQEEQYDHDIDSEDDSEYVKLLVLVLTIF